MAARPKRLKYHGEKVVADTGPDGQPTRYGYDRFFFGVPPRDLDEADIARLDDDTLKNIMGKPPGGEPLYTNPDAGKKGDDDKEPAKAPAKGAKTGNGSKATKSNTAPKAAEQGKAAEPQAPRTADLSRAETTMVEPVREVPAGGDGQRPAGA